MRHVKEFKKIDFIKAPFYVFPFGKYKGKHIRYVMNKDPNYIKWFYRSKDADKMSVDANRFFEYLCNPYSERNLE